MCQREFWNENEEGQGVEEGREAGSSGREECRSGMYLESPTGRCSAKHVVGGGWFSPVNAECWYLREVPSFPQLRKGLPGV